MTKEEFIKQRCEIDNITLRQFEKEYRVVECNCGAPYCKGFRCLDLDGLLKENKQLKERVDYLERSNNRREDTIIEQRQEISNLEDNWNKSKENKKNKMILDKDMFDFLYPVGTVYWSIDKKLNLPHGEWEYIGCNLMTYFFKRIK